jgi:hypothetical protein
VTTEQDERLGYDADHDDPRQYCQHGSWMGSWWGPDYLCSWCEGGYTADQARYCQLLQAVSRAKEGPRVCWIPGFVENLGQYNDGRYSSALATVAVTLVHKNYDELVAYQRHVRRAQAALRLWLMQHKDFNTNSASWTNVW